jgi:hypothetical protein
VAARIIEPVSKLDSLRVLEEAGLAPVPYRTATRRLRVFARQAWRQQISAACAAHARLGPASLVLYDCSTLYFETDAGDGFRESGFSKERRLEPQITIGLTGADGFPLMVSAFEGNKAETILWNLFVWFGHVLWWRTSMTGSRLPVVGAVSWRGVSPAGVGVSASLPRRRSIAACPSSTAACSSSVSGIAAVIFCRLDLASRSCALAESLGV